VKIESACNPAVPAAVFTVKTPFEVVAVRIEGPAGVKEIWMTPEYPLVAPALGAVRVKLTNAPWLADPPPIFPIKIGIKVAAAPLPVVNTVVVPTTLAVTTSLGFVWV